MANLPPDDALDQFPPVGDLDEPFPRGLILAGSRVDLCTQSQFLGEVVRRLTSTEARPLAMCSANLDHVHHFAPGQPSHGSLRDPHQEIDWTVTLDGVPHTRVAARHTDVRWPRLTGADLLLPILVVAAQHRVKVGFVGGTDEMQTELLDRLDAELPELARPATWAPPRAAIDDHRRSVELADDIRAHGVELLVVGLGKPRQEAWIDRYGSRTGARVLLATGAAADFFAGVSSRAPTWAQNSGLEWLYRLALDPGRLWRRYLVQGPPAARRLLRESGAPASTVLASTGAS